MSNRGPAAFATVLVALIVFVCTSAGFAAPAKVDVCHVKGNGGVVLINVSERALNAHLSHGDWEAVGGSCEATSDFLEFTSVAWTDFYGEWAEVSWTVTGYSGPVEFIIEFDDEFGWTEIFFSPVVGTGEGSYDVFDFSYAPSYRIRAINLDTGEEVISPIFY